MADGISREPGESIGRFIGAKRTNGKRGKRSITVLWPCVKLPDLGRSRKERSRFEHVAVLDRVPCAHRNTETQSMTLVKRIALCALLSGCSSNYAGPVKQANTTIQPTPVDPGVVAQFYHPVVGAAGDTTRTEPPQYIYAGSENEAQALNAKYLQNGYHQVGSSGWSNLDASPVESLILAQAKRIGADIAIYYAADGGREDVNIPLVTGGYMPESLMRTNHSVTFLAH
jgi:hypothetical protein